MTDDTGPVPYLDDHCAGHNPDQFHNLCPRRFRSQFGVEHACTCPAHANDAQEESAD